MQLLTPGLSGAQAQSAAYRAALRSYRAGGTIAPNRQAVRTTADYRAMAMAARRKILGAQGIVIDDVTGAPVSTKPLVSTPIPKSTPLPFYQKRTISPVKTVAKTRTVYAVKKMPRAEPVLVGKTVSPKKTNWLPLALGAGAALLMMKGGG